MNVNETTMFFFFLSPQVSEGPQKPQTLPASKTNKKNWTKNLNSSLKNRYFGVLIFLEHEFFATLKIHDPKNFNFQNFFNTIITLISMIKKIPLIFFKLKQ